MTKIPAHFAGKEALEHVIDARIRGKEASQELHGAETPGHFVAGFDAAKETAFLLLLLYLLGVSFGFEPSRLHFFLLLVSLSWVVWKAGRSAILGWGRLERLHRLVEQERWEIEHHRSQEKEELRALYAAKGFHGKLLDEAVEVLMADDNRLLQVMLEEELGLQLESYEHPLKQAFGALVGGVAAAALLALSLFFHPYWAPVLSALIVIIGSAAWSARRERNRPLPALIWNLAAALLAAAFALVLAP